MNNVILIVLIVVQVKGLIILGLLSYKSMIEYKAELGLYTRIKNGINSKIDQKFYNH